MVSSNFLSPGGAQHPGRARARDGPIMGRPGRNYECQLYGKCLEQESTRSEEPTGPRDFHRMEPLNLGALPTLCTSSSC